MAFIGQKVKVDSLSKRQKKTARRGLTGGQFFEKMATTSECDLRRQTEALGGALNQAMLILQF